MEYLEKAVAIEPSNVTARRGLAVLKGKIDPKKLVDPRAAPRQRAAEVETTGQSFQCPHCGGRMSFDLQTERLTCEYCGHSEVVKVDDRQVEELEEVFDFVAPTQAGHNWAQAAQQFKCEKCGALSVLPAGQSMVQCAYCGSNQFIQNPEHTDMLDPQGVLLMKINEDEAVKQANRWLGKGMFSPDNIKTSQTTIRLRPAYYSAWTFDGTVEVRWSCEVSEGSGRYKRWRPINGVESRFFNDVIASGIKGFNDRELDKLGPFEPALAEVFNPKLVAGWPVILYDRPMADASLGAREKVLRQLRPEMYDFVAMGQEKRNVQVGACQWSGLTFKHLLVPLWLGEYQFQGKPFRLLVNGQTGKVVGDKPKDTFKVWMSLLLALGIIVLLSIVLWILIDSGII
jgi:DNA-directed RNA polymerase subunit RPC12/RpoP